MEDQQGGLTKLQFPSLLEAITFYFLLVPIWLVAIGVMALSIILAAKLVGIAWNSAFAPLLQLRRLDWRVGTDDFLTFLLLPGLLIGITFWYRLLVYLLTLYLRRCPVEQGRAGQRHRNSRRQKVMRHLVVGAPLAIQILRHDFRATEGGARNES